MARGRNHCESASLSPTDRLASAPADGSPVRHAIAISLTVGIEYVFYPNIRDTCVLFVANKADDT